MIRIRNILIPVDFSESSEKALRYGIEIAKDRQSKLYLLHVVDERLVENLHELSLKGYKGDFMEAYRRMIKNREDELSQMIPAEWKASLEIDCNVARGKPSAEILKFAEDHNVDMIIVGTKGRSALKEALVGSVARNLVNHAGCPVLVVRDLAHDFVY